MKKIIHQTQATGTGWELLSETGQTPGCFIGTFCLPHGFVNAMCVSVGVPGLLRLLRVPASVTRVSRGLYTLWFAVVYLDLLALRGMREWPL